MPAFPDKVLSINRNALFDEQPFRLAADLHMNCLCIVKQGTTMHKETYYGRQLSGIGQGCLFEIRVIESSEAQTVDELTQPHSHAHFEVIWIVHGNGRFCVDMHSEELKGNQVFCVGPGQVYRFAAADAINGYIISFDQSFLSISGHEPGAPGLLQLLSGSRGIALPDEAAGELREFVARMMKEFSNEYPFRTDILKRLLKIFLIYLARQCQEDFRVVRQSREISLVQRFIQAVEKDFKRQKMVTAYARQLFVTPNYLNEIVKKNTGCSAGHHIRQRVALEAKRMGRYSDTCMKEIAYSLGFLDSAHFSKFFKTVTGSNFSEFKKELVTVSF